MSIALRSLAKINLGLKIGPRRADGFHELRTIYQTIALHDVVRVNVEDGEGIEILRRRFPEFTKRVAGHPASAALARGLDRMARMLE